MVAPGICHVKARLVDLIGSSGIENATSAQPKNLASAPRLSPLRFFGGVAGDETTGIELQLPEVPAATVLQRVKGSYRYRYHCNVSYQGLIY